MMMSIFSFLILGIGFSIVCAHEKDPLKRMLLVPLDFDDDEDNSVKFSYEQFYEPDTFKIVTLEPPNDDDHSRDFSNEEFDVSEFMYSTIPSESCCCCSSYDEEYSGTYASFTPSPDSPISNVTINEKIPLYYEHDSGRKNVNLKMCKEEWKQKNNAYYSEMEPTFKLLISLCANDTHSEISLKGLMNSFENISDSHSLWDIERNKQIVRTLSLLMEGISSVALSITFSKGKSQTVDQNSMGIQTTLITPKSLENNETLRLKAKGDQMAIHPRAVAATATITDPIAVAFISYVGLKSLLEETLLQNGTFLGNETLTGFNMNSRLVSVFTSNHTTDISTPVNLTFQHLKNRVAQEKVLCVQWISGALSSHGCQQIFSNITHTECSCQYLSSFAVLMATAHKQRTGSKAAVRDPAPLGSSSNLDLRLPELGHFLAWDAPAASSGGSPPASAKVRKAYWHWIYCKKDIGPPVSEITMTSVPISNPLVKEPCINEVHNKKIEWQEQA